MTPHVPGLKPSTKVTIYNEGVVSGGGTERSGARVSSPLGGGHAPGRDFERDKARHIVIQGLYSQDGEDPRDEGWGGAWDGVRVGRHGRCGEMER